MCITLCVSNYSSPMAFKNELKPTVRVLTRFSIRNKQIVFYAPPWIEKIIINLITMIYEV